MLQSWTAIRITLLAILFIFIFSLMGWCLDQKEIALTFDDGPRPEVLEKLLPFLKSHNVPATFFVIGAVAKDHPDWLRKETVLGHEIENHSYGHENMRKLFGTKGLVAVFTNIETAARVIYKATGQEPRFFRPPYWEITDDLKKEIETLGYIVMRLEKPDLNSLDYEDVEKHRLPEVLIERVKKIIANREQKGQYTHVFVFHELPLTLHALETLIPYFKSIGYQFVRLDAIL